PNPRSAISFQIWPKRYPESFCLGEGRTGALPPSWCEGFLGHCLEPRCVSAFFRGECFARVPARRTRYRPKLGHKRRVVHHPRTSGRKESGAISRGPPRNPAAFALRPRDLRGCSKRHANVDGGKVDGHSLSRLVQQWRLQVSRLRGFPAEQRRVADFHSQWLPCE